MIDISTSISPTRIVNYSKDKCGINTIAVWDRRRILVRRIVNVLPFTNFQELRILFECEARYNISDILIRE